MSTINSAFAKFTTDEFPPAYVFAIDGTDGTLRTIQTIDLGEVNENFVLLGMSDEYENFTDYHGVINLPVISHKDFV